MDYFDAIALLGLILLTIGFYFVYPPAAAIVAGGFLLLYGVIGARNNGDTG